MKFYDCAVAPSPRRVRVFMAEKGITLPTIQVDLRKSRRGIASGRRRLLRGCRGTEARCG
jgi:glutathione S-transferase